jgi:hypothetical protein
VARRVLLVEGTDDEHVLKHICGNRGLAHLDDVEPYGGVEALLAAVPTALRAGNQPGDVVGVVVDADEDLGRRWEDIRSRFEEAGYPNLPAAPDPAGTVLEPPDDSLLPRAGVWLMPDNKTPGILEDFLRFLVPVPDALLDHAKASVDSLPDRRFAASDEPKAVIHTWLAWQAEPGRPYGTAITARYLDPGVPQVDVLVAWLRRLFA